eukprot:Opistho-2@83849
MRRRPVHLAYVVTQEMIDLLDLARACVEALRRILNDKVAATIASLPALLGVAALARALPEIDGSDNDYQRASKGFRDVMEASNSVQVGDDAQSQQTELEAVYATNVFSGDKEVTALMTQLRGRIGSIATSHLPALKVDNATAKLIYAAGFNRVVNESVFMDHAAGAQRVQRIANESAGYYTGRWLNDTDHRAPRFIDRPTGVARELLRTAFNGTWIHFSGCSTTRFLFGAMVRLLSNALGARVPQIYEKEMDVCWQEYARNCTLFKNVTYYHTLLCQCRTASAAVPITVAVDDVEYAAVSRKEAVELLRSNRVMSALVNYSDHVCDAQSSPQCRLGMVPSTTPIRRGAVSVLLTYRWKETSFDEPIDRDLIGTLMREVGMDRPPDVLAVNAGIHAFHVYKGPNTPFLDDGLVPPEEIEKYFAGLVRFVDALHSGPSDLADQVTGRLPT